MGNANAVQFNAAIVQEFRANGGYVSGPLADTPLILVHHVGARSGIERVVPLAYLRQADGHFVITASDGGAPKHPAWYYNLKANPKITVEVGTERFWVTAEELGVAARTAVWPMIVHRAPAANEYQNKTTRTIPVFILTRDD